MANTCAAVGLFSDSTDRALAGEVGSCANRNDFLRALAILLQYHSLASDGAISGLPWVHQRSLDTHAYAPPLLAAMNCRFLLAVLLHYEILLLCFANRYESDDIDFDHRQLDLATEDHTLQLRLESSHGTSTDDVAADAILSDPLDELRKALDVMQSTWFKVWVGTWPTAIDWTRAVLDAYLVSALSSLSKALHSSQQQREVENEINLYFSQNVGVDLYAFSGCLFGYFFLFTRPVHCSTIIKHKDCSPSTVSQRSVQTTISVSTNLQERHLS